MTHITVLCACYQGEKWLPDQLRTLQEQDDPDFSVLLQDDGSTDGTLALLQRTSEEDPRFHLAADNGRHFGAAGNFLSLMRQVGDGWVALCDQDDLWQANRISACRSAMEDAERRYGADIPILVHSDSRVLRENGDLLYDSFFAHQGWDGGACELRRLLVQNNVTGCTVLMNRPLCELAASCTDSEQIFMHDWFLAQTAAAFGHVVFIPEQLVGYRQHEKNVIGASKSGMLGRAAKALAMRGKVKERLALNYRVASGFRKIYGDSLPAAAAETIDRFLKTENEPKPLRIYHIVRGGYRMQNWATRLGQILFG